MFQKKIIRKLKTEPDRPLKNEASVYMERLLSYFLSFKSPLTCVNQNLYPRLSIMLRGVPIHLFTVL